MGVDDNDSGVRRLLYHNTQKPHTLISTRKSHAELATTGKGGGGGRGAVSVVYHTHMTIFTCRYGF